MAIHRPGRPKRFYPDEEKGNPPPDEPGLYRFGIPGEEKLEYIGESANLEKRLKQHLYSGKLKPGRFFDWKKSDKRSTSKTRRNEEKRQIEKNKPTLNKSKGGEGPKGKKINRGNGKLPIEQQYKKGKIEKAEGRYNCSTKKWEIIIIPGKFSIHSNYELSWIKNTFLNTSAEIKSAESRK